MSWNKEHLEEFYMADEFPLIILKDKSGNLFEGKMEYNEPYQFISRQRIPLGTVLTDSETELRVTGIDGMVWPEGCPIPYSIEVIGEMND